MPSEEIKKAISAWLDADAECELTANDAREAWERDRKAKATRTDCEHALRLLAEVGLNDPSKSYLIHGQRALINIDAVYVHVTAIEE